MQGNERYFRSRQTYKRGHWVNDDGSTMPCREAGDKEMCVTNIVDMMIKRAKRK